jgi:chemotaxis protein histidine kinase CheA
MQLLESPLWGEGHVQPDIFHDRLKAVRQRFASSLAGKIQDTRSQLASLSGDRDGVVDAVAATYRLIHGICGIGAAVGFAVTGRAAKDVEDVLVSAYREQRGLAADEVVRLVARLDALSTAAEAELGSAAVLSTSKSEG